MFASDMTRYYYKCSVGDYEFTETISYAVGAGDSRLQQSFNAAKNNTFSQNINNLSPPVKNHLWPVNNFMPAKTLQELRQYIYSEEHSEFSQKVDFIIDKVNMMTS